MEMAKPRTTDGMENAVSENEAKETPSTSASLQKTDYHDPAESRTMITSPRTSPGYRCKDLAPPHQGFLRRSCSAGGFLQALSFDKRLTAFDVENSCSSPCSTASKRLGASNSISGFIWKRCTSLPVKHVSNPNVPATARSLSENQKSHLSASEATVLRSLSVTGRKFVIVRTSSVAAREKHSPGPDGSPATTTTADEDQEIPEDEALCRICLDDCDERNTLKMQCGCRGALRLVHEDCAVKWFSLKGNKVCEICGQVVSNLPVTLHRLASTGRRDNRALNQQNLNTTRAYRAFVLLLLITSVCYFLFLEQLLLPDMKDRAVLIAGPFAFTLGFMTSILAVILAIREYIWVYAALQFILVAMLLHIFYSMVQLQLIYAVLVAAVLGFGLAMSINCFYIGYVTLRFQATQDSNPT